jgi:hypothetical protein
MLIREYSVMATLRNKHPMNGGKVLNRETINQHLVKAQYAVRGELAIRAEELKEAPL